MFGCSHFPHAALYICIHHLLVEGVRPFYWFVDPVFLQPSMALLVSCTQSRPTLTRLYSPNLQLVAYSKVNRIRNANLQVLKAGVGKNMEGENLYLWLYNAFSFLLLSL
eukprot:Gb_32324 [translate_table: standard]